VSTIPLTRASLPQLIFVGLVLGLVPGCRGTETHAQTAGQPHPGSETGRNAPLSILDKAAVVWTGARDLQRSEGPYGSRSLTYRVTLGYPAPMLLKEIHSRLRRQGWKPRAEDFLNPGLEPSTADVSGGPLEGWGEYEDGTVKPEKRIHVWQGQWDGPRGDILVYDLRYSTPITERRISDALRVAVEYYPREAVAAFVAGVDKIRGESPH
jgi:hypothetical protein